MIKHAESKKRKGFTLVELMVVVAVLMILSVAAVVAYNGFELEARRAALRSDAQAFVTALNNTNSISKNPIVANTGVYGTNTGEANAFVAGADTPTGEGGVVFTVEGNDMVCIVHSENGMHTVPIQMSLANAGFLRTPGVESTAATAMRGIIRYTTVSSGATALDVWTVDEVALAAVKDIHFTETAKGVAPTTAFAS